MIYKIKYIEYFNISPNGADSNAAGSVKNNYGNRVSACLRRSARQRETSPGTVENRSGEKIRNSFIFKHLELFKNFA